MEVMRIGSPNESRRRTSPACQRDLGRRGAYEIDKSQARTKKPSSGLGCSAEVIGGYEWSLMEPLRDSAAARVVSELKLDYR